MRVSYAVVTVAIVLNIAACGQDPKIDGRSTGVGIVNGEPVKIDPTSPARSVVGLVFMQPAQPGDLPTDVRQEVCTGTLVSENIVLTAAHCVDAPFAQGVVVFATDFKNATRANVRKIVDKSVNGEWQRTGVMSTDIGDTAIIKFSGSLPAGYAPAEILGDSSVLSVGTNTLQMGYGIAYPSAKDKGVGKLRQATVAILDTTTARTEILTDESHGQGVCEGDSGGPAFVNVNGKYLLWGVASRVFGPSAEDLAKKGKAPVVLCNDVSLETNIVPWLNWLKTEMARLGGGEPNVSAPVETAKLQSSEIRSE